MSIKINFEGNGGERYIMGLNKEQLEKYLEMDEYDFFMTCYESPDNVETTGWLLNNNDGIIKGITINNEESIDKEIIKKIYVNSLEEYIPIKEILKDNILDNSVAMLYFREDYRSGCDIEIETDNFDPDKLTFVLRSFCNDHDSNRVSRVVYDGEIYELDWEEGRPFYYLGIYEFEFEDCSEEEGSSFPYMLELVNPLREVWKR